MIRIVETQIFDEMKTSNSISVNIYFRASAEILHGNRAVEMSQV